MNLAFYDLPKPETIKRFTVSIQASGTPTTSKWKLKHLEEGKTLNGNPRKMPFRKRK